MFNPTLAPPAQAQTNSAQRIKAQTSQSQVSWRDEIHVEVRDDAIEEAEAVSGTNP